MTAEAIASGRYRVERTLGHGGMATVYLARDVELDRPVAVKVLAENLAADADFRKRFLREARLAARLSHPNVVHVYDAGDDGGRPYIVMEHVHGETLADVLARRRKLPPDEVSRLGRQAALGLQHAHEAGLVHRDVKPQNLLLRDDAVLKVADFGIARAAETTRLTQVGTVLGTAAYLAPEQARGEEATPAADVYSLGAVLYELLTGRPPYSFASLAELAEQQRAGTIVPVRDLEPTIPDALEAIVMQCLAREPRFRPPTARDVAESLAASVGPATETAATVVLPNRVMQSVPGRTTWIWIAAAVVVAALALALGLARLGGPSSSSGRHTPPAVPPIPHGATPAAGARALARWLRAHSR